MLLRKLLVSLMPQYGSEAVFYIAMTAAIAGTAVTTVDQINANKARQRLLDEELKNNELAALDEENRRLLQLRMANDEMMTARKGIDAWASPSLIAMRAFNFDMGMQDIENTRLNIQSQRSSIDTKINVLKANNRAILTSGILTGIGQGINTGYSGSQLGKTRTAETVAQKTQPTPDRNSSKVQG